MTFKETKEQFLNCLEGNENAFEDMKKQLATMYKLADDMLEKEICFSDVMKKTSEHEKMLKKRYNFLESLDLLDIYKIIK